MKVVELDMREIVAVKHAQQQALIELHAARQIYTTTRVYQLVLVDMFL